MKQGLSDKVLNRDARKTSQGFVDIKTKTVEQLKELIERQNKLLQNRSFLEKLPDKGKKIYLFKTELEVELKKREEEYDATCQLMLNLGLSDKTIGEMEWNKGKLTTNNRELDSDDDIDDDDDDILNDKTSEVEVNPLKIIATHSGTLSEKKIKINSVSKSLNSAEKTFYVNKISEKCDKSNSVKERFKPNQLRNNDKTLFKTSAEKVRTRLGNKWEITQATPPAPVYQDTLMISLSESIKLQQEQAEKLKEIEKKNAAERLLGNVSVKMGDKLPQNNIKEFRNSKNIFDESTEENEEESSDSDTESKERRVYFVETDDWES